MRRFASENRKNGNSIESIFDFFRVRLSCSFVRSFDSLFVDLLFYRIPVRLSLFLFIVVDGEMMVKLHSIFRDFFPLHLIFYHFFLSNRKLKIKIVNTSGMSCKWYAYQNSISKLEEEDDVDEEKKTAQINKQTNENTQCAKIFIYDSITTHTRTHHIIYIFIYVRMHGKQLIRIRTELQKFTHHSTIVHTTYSNEWNKFGWKSTTKPVILNIRTIIHDGRKQTKVCACSLTLGLLRFRRRCCCCCFFTVWFFFRVRFVFVAVAAATAAHVLSHTLCIDSVYAYDRILWRQSLPIRFAATLSWRIRYSFGSMCVRVHM